MGKESSAGTGSAAGQAGFPESIAVLVCSFLKKLAFLASVSSTHHAALQPSRPLEALDQFYKIIYILWVKTGCGGSFPLDANLLSRSALLAPAAARNEGFLFKIPKEKLLVNAEHSSLVEIN